MSERERAIETLVLLAREMSLRRWMAGTWRAWYRPLSRPELGRIVDALASQPVVERQITEEMAEELIECLSVEWRLVDFTDEWRDLPEHEQLATARGWLEAALGAPSQETGELERLRPIVAHIAGMSDRYDYVKIPRQMVLDARSSLSPNQPEGE